MIRLLRCCLTLTLTLCLFLGVTGFKGCFKRSADGGPSTAEKTLETAGPIVETAVRVMKAARPLFETNGVSTAFLDKAIKIGDPLVAAFNSGADDLLEQAAAFLDAFDQIVLDVELIKNPTVRTLVLLALLAADEALRELAERVEKELPQFSHALYGDKKKAVETIKKFARKGRLNCRVNVTIGKYKPGQYAPMLLCKEHPLETEIERVKPKQ